MYRALIEALLVISVAWLAWMVLHPPKEPVGRWVEAPIASPIKNVGTEVIPASGVQVYKPKAKEKLDLPPEIKDNSHKHVASAVSIKADDHPHTVTAVYDDTTGIVAMFDRKEPLPWLAAENKFRIRIGPGFKTGSGQVWRLGGDWNAIQTKALHLGADGTIDTDGKGYAGLHLELQF